MKEFFALLIKNISSIIGRMSGKKKPPPIRCQFCGEMGHDEDNCPKAAKYKLFGEREG